jgi:CDP-glycerol glycerophosphotransferase (TagB/SpsB family)
VKTIFLTIYDGDTEKVILRSGPFEHLKASGHNIVLLIRGEKRLDYYKQQFEKDGVSVELVPKDMTVAEDLWYHWSWNTVPTHSVYVRQMIRRHRGGAFWRYVLERLAWTLGHARAWRAFLRFAYASVPDRYAHELFEKYKPDLLFAPNMFSPMDFRLMRYARKRGIASVATAKSWDVLTTKAFTRVKADKLLVFNEINKEEAIRLGDYKATQVEITGFPQFDIYTRSEWHEGREAFYKRMGLDPERRTILFAIPGDWKTPSTKDILHALDDAIERGEMGKLQILARLHPKYPDSSEKEVFKHIVMDRPGTILTQKKEFSIDMGISGTYAFTFTDDDIKHLANSILYSDVVINTESTLTLDASMLDKPVILIGYDGDQKPGYWDSVERIYERDHYRHVLKTGGAPLAKSDEELIATINTFLKDPEHLRAEREELKRRMLYKLDGEAAKRTADAVLAML